MPRVDVSDGVETVAQIPDLQTVRLDMIMGLDGSRWPSRGDTRYIYLIDERGRMLAEDTEERLRRRVDDMQAGRNVTVTVRYVGADERVYYGSPWR
jgi:hypothetical protein